MYLLDEKEREELMRMRRMYDRMGTPPGITSNYLFDNVRSFNNDSKSISDSVKGVYGKSMNPVNKNSVYGTDGANHIGSYMNISNKALLNGLYGKTADVYRSDKSGKGVKGAGGGGKSGGGKASSSGKGSSSSSSSGSSSGGGK